MIFAGIDIGSTTAKAVLMNEEGKIRGAYVCRTGFDPVAASEEVLGMVLAQTGCSRDEIKYCVSTGYGREQVSFADRQVTEITCHGKGAHILFPQARGIIDIGGQDSKAIVLSDTGMVENFAMNDKCAAGTGRFLEVMASIMNVTTEEMGRLSLQATEKLMISSICTVFAESEVISLISQKKNPYDIMAGVHNSVARRVGTLVERVKMPRPIVLTGGVGKNVGVKAAFEELLHTELLVPEDPQIVGAIGAAEIARTRYLRGR